MNIGNVNMNFGIHLGGMQGAVPETDGVANPRQETMVGGLVVGEAASQVGKPDGCGGIEPSRLKTAFLPNDPLDNLVHQVFDMEAPPLVIPR